jgi:hypothetical protein
MVTKLLLRAARAATVAAVVVAASDRTVADPANQVALHLASVRNEKEKLRRKLTEGLQYGRMDKATRLWVPDRETCTTRAGPEPPADRLAGSTA